MADDNQNSGGDGCRKSILWGLSFGVVSAIAFKTMSALFPGRTTEQNPAQVMIDDTSKTMVRVPFHKLIVMHNDCKKSIWNKQCEAYDEIKKLCLGSAAGPTPSDIGRSLLLESFNGCMYKARSSPKEQSACWETYSKLMPTK